MLDLLSVPVRTTLIKEGIINPTPKNRTERILGKGMLPLIGVMSVVLSCSLFTSPPNAPTSTPQPTATAEPSETRQATPNKAPTQNADPQETDAAKTDFAGAALTEVSSKLDAVGETMGSGSIAYWNSDPMAVTSSKPNVITYQLLDSSIQGADFAFHSNITWEVKQKVGLVYCIMMFRISGDIAMDPWYMMRMGRISGAGHILFDVMQNWNIIGESNGDISNYIRVGNGDTNEVLLVARANQFTAYVNGKQVSVWWNAKIDLGSFGFGTLQDTGTSVCTFADSWIYTFD